MFNLKKWGASQKRRKKDISTLLLQNSARFLPLFLLKKMENHTLGIIFLNLQSKKLGSCAGNPIFSPPFGFQEYEKLH
jgi:hypothetical protein